MSGLGNYELENILWESSDNDDHIVPYAGDKKTGYASERDKFRKSRNELKHAGSNAESALASENITERKEESSLDAVKEDKKTMLEKRHWTYSTNGGFPTSVDGDAKRKYPDSEFCTTDGDLVLGDHGFAGVNDLKQYLSNDPSGTENDLAFLRNALEDEGANDLLFYGWPELENLDDVDNMLRDCDPTFSLDIDNCDDLSWLSSSQTIEGSDDILKAGFNLSGSVPCCLSSISEQQEGNEQRNNDLAVNETNKKLSPGGAEREMLKFVPDTCSTLTESNDNGSGVIDHIEAQSQIQSHVGPAKHQKLSEGKGKSWSSENGVSFIHFDKLNEAGEANYLANTQHCFSQENHQHQESNQPVVRTPNPMINPNHHPSERVFPSSRSSLVKPEVAALPTISPRLSSHASNQMQSVESSSDVSYKTLTCSEKKKKSKLHQRRLSRQAEKSIMRVQKADSDMFCAKNPIAGGENEAESQNKVNGCDIGFSGELGSSTNQESSCFSSVLDEAGIDASSLKQLQHVMGQLDIRTKLCIRDSLYRLARSAAQRHKCDDQSNGGGDDKDANGALLSVTNKSTGFIDMETDTNPIDRSIAHLLFHRPSDPSASATPADPVAVKANIMVEGPNPLTTETPLCRGKTTCLDGGITEQKLKL